eukprot:CAMPEP_0180243088 /NCGR_PEP_ID=MMETSP0987-20121128/33629_1 /TAXON_ID=697907 /ORGANISM="non described non described, Strain CCMP2293" /LENGTH=194 /DNA_ID=CAMNT_0022210363 /DNA_START=107 /DNA_END=687 /DNA_ORIENTATION=+
MEKYLGGMLQEFMSDFLLDFKMADHAKLRLFSWKGSSLELKDLKIDPAWLRKLMPGCPVVISRGHIDTVTVRANFQSLKTEPLRVEVGRVTIEITEPVVLPRDEPDTTPNEAPGLRPGKKKKFSLLEKIWTGIHWSIGELHISVATLGEDKVEGLLSAPPTAHIILRELSFFSTNEFGTECDLKAARAYSKDFP